MMKLGKSFIFLQPSSKIRVKGQVQRYLAILLMTITFGSLFAVQNYQVRTRVDLVVVPASVRDSKGRLVHRLTQKDFTILEDGAPQTISNFSDDPQPLTAAIVIDTGMPGIAMRRLVPLFISITDGFSDFDEMASFRYDHFVFQLSDFTNDRAKIEKSFDVVKTIAEKQPAYGNSGGSGPSVPSPVRVDGTPRPATEAVPTVGTRRVAPSRVLFDALYEAATALQNRPANRRRIILLVSDGDVTANVNEHSLAQVRDLLLRQNIELYSVNTDSNPIGRRLGLLASLSRSTGGDEFVGVKTSSMENAFARITEQARNQYVLGYHSTNEPKNGLMTVRNIEVKGRNSSWKITHRNNYMQIP